MPSKEDLKPGTRYRLEHTPQAKSTRLFYVRLTEKCLRTILETKKESGKTNTVLIKFDNEDLSRGKLSIPNTKSQNKVFSFDQYGQNDGSVRVSSVYRSERSCPKRLSLLGSIDQRISVSAGDLPGLKPSPDSDARAVTDEQLEALKTHCVYLLAGLDGWIGRRELIERLNRELYGNLNYHRTVRRDLLEKAMKSVADQKDGGSAMTKSREPHYRLNKESGIEAFRRLSPSQLEAWRHYSASERKNALRLHSKKPAETRPSKAQEALQCSAAIPASQGCDKVEDTPVKETKSENQDKEALFDEYLRLYDFIESVAKEFKALSDRFHRAEDDKERKEIEQRIHDRYDQLVGSEDYKQRKRRYEELYNALLPYCEVDEMERKTGIKG